MNKEQKLQNHRDPAHQEQIERWAKFCLENPSQWKKIQKEFIDAQFIMAERFYNNLSQTKEGREKLRELKRQKRNDLFKVLYHVKSTF